MEQPAAASVGILDSALGVILKPREFFQQMPKTGGFGAPLVFMIVMGVVSGLVQAVLFFAGLNPGMGLAAAVASIIVTPIVLLIFGFIGAGILFVVWKLMGSQESYETAYRCMAYTAAIAPLNGLIGAIPWIGHPIGMVWSTVLMILASIETHKIRPIVAQVVFGGLCAVFIVGSIGAQLAARAVRGAMAGGANPLQEMAMKMQAEALKAQQQALQQQGMQPGMQGQPVGLQTAPGTQPGAQPMQMPPNLTPEQQAQLQQMQKALQQMQQQFPQQQGQQGQPGQQQR